MGSKIYLVVEADVVGSVPKAIGLIRSMPKPPMLVFQSTPGEDGGSVSVRTTRTVAVSDRMFTVPAEAKDADEGSAGE